MGKLGEPTEPTEDPNFAAFDRLCSQLISAQATAAVTASPTHSLAANEPTRPPTNNATRIPPPMLQHPSRPEAPRLAALFGARGPYPGNHISGRE